MTNRRLTYNGVRVTLGVALTAGATAVTFSSPLVHAAGTNVPTLAGGDYIPLAIIDPATGALTEVVRLTAYTAGASVGTITRAQEGTTAVAHAIGRIVVCAPLNGDRVGHTATGNRLDSAVAAPSQPEGLRMITGLATATFSAGIGSFTFPGSGFAGGLLYLGVTVTSGTANAPVINSSQATKTGFTLFITGGTGSITVTYLAIGY